MGKLVGRQVDYDWIRVIATFVVVLYHCSMFFNPFPWHVKNNVINTSYILFFSLLVDGWIMPLFFVISGVSSFYALKKRDGKAYLKNRFARLGIPLLFGIFILSPPQVYIERITHNQYSGSFLSFIPHYFDGVYLDIGGSGNFAFVGLHLWYLLELLLFSILTLPLFLRKHSNQDKPFGYRHYLLLPIILLIIVCFLSVVNIGGWGILFYLVIFLYGFYYFSRPAFKLFIRNKGLLFGLIALISGIGYSLWFMIGVPENGTLSSLFFTILRVMFCWNALFVIFNLGEKHLKTQNKFLVYANEASMPIYVIHQPIIVVTGFFIRNLSWSVPSKILFLVPVTFLMIFMSYHFIVKRFKGTRVLFGMKA